MSNYRIGLDEWSEVNELLRAPKMNFAEMTMQMIMFIPGRAQDDYQELLELATGPATKVCIPGHDGSYVLATGERVPTGYPGFEVWKKHLEQRGVVSENIYPCIVREGHEKITHTREEAEGFVLQAKAQGWHMAYVVAHPHQMARVVCCLLLALRTFKHSMLIYPVMLPDTDFNKLVYGSLGQVKKPRWEHVAEEIFRLEAYMSNGWCVHLYELKQYLLNPNPLG